MGADRSDKPGDADRATAVSHSRSTAGDASAELAAADAAGLGSSSGARAAAAGSSAATAAAPDPWTVLRQPVFRALWLASVASNVGTWIQSVAAVWLMSSLTPTPAMTALVQTAASLPLVLFALPAGALADMVDRRRLLIGSQLWMLAASASLGAVTLLGDTSPAVLLGLTFALGIGAAFTTPAWQSLNLELVSRADLPAAVALGSASLNGARAVGPGLGGLVVSLAGPPAAFLLNSASFVGVVAVLLRWRREPAHTHLPREHVFGAIRAGLRFVRHSPALHRVFTRAALFVFSSSALLALLPVLARQDMGLDATGYGVLLAGFGAGAVAGAAALPRAQARLGTGRLIDIASAALTLALAGLTTVPAFPMALVLLFVAGLSWMVPLSSLSIATQTIAPAWVRARALAFHLLVLQGSLAAGSAAWGWAADLIGVTGALWAAAGAAGVAAAIGSQVALKSTDHLDLSPAVRPLPRDVAEAIEHDEGPVLVTVEYQIDLAREEEFADTMHVVRRMRRRGGAFRWGLFTDAARPGVYVESFLVESWLDHLRQHERMTVTDREISFRARAFHVGAEPPIVRHLVARLPLS